MKKTLVTIFSLIILLIAAIAILPSVINWDQYKDEITTKAKEATGRDIVINGAIKLSILPSPSIIVHEIQVGNPDGFQSQSPFAKLDKIKIDAALKPLLKKQLHITGISLINPTIHLQKNGDKINWDFSKPLETSAQPQEISSKSSFQPELSFDEIEISNGMVIYQDGDAVNKVTPINATLKGDSLKGPFTLAGNLNYNTIPANFTVSTSAIKDDQPTVIKTALFVDSNNAVIQIIATVDSKDSAKTSGKINLNINDLERLIGSLKEGKAPILPPLLKNKIQAAGDLSQSEKGMNLDNLAIAIGELNIKGNATYSNDQKLGISLASNTVDMRGSKKSPQQKSSNVKENNTYIKTIDDLFNTASALIGTSIPNDMTAAFELRIKKLITQDNATLDNLEISALLDKNSAKISKISAQLPGQSSFLISATLPLKDKKIESIDADIAFKAQNTNQALFAFGVDDLGAGFSPLDTKAKLKITAKEMSIDDTTLKFGKNNVSGLKASYSPSAKIPVILNINGGDLDFNTLQNKQDETAASKENTEQSKSLGLSSDVAQKLDGLKANVNVKLNQIISGQSLARNITLNSQINGEKITIQEASIGDLGDLNSLNLKITGAIGKLNPFDDIDLTINASSDNLSRTMWAFGNKNAGDIGKANLAATIKGSQESVALKANGQVDQGTLTIDGVVKNLAEAPSLTGQVTAKHPETSVILKNFANMKTDNKKMGPFSMSAKLIASANKFKTEELAVNMGDQGTISGYINFDKTVTPGVIDVKLDADLLPLGNLTGAKTNRVGGGQGATAAPKTWSQKPTDLSVLRNTSGTIAVNVKKLTYDAFIFDNFDLLATVRNSTLTLEKLAANMFDGSFDVKGSVTAAQTGQAHKGQFAITIADTNVEKVFSALGSKAFGGGTLSLKQSLSFSGANQLNIIKSLNGTGDIIVENGSFNGLDLDSLATKIDRPNSPSDFIAIIQQAQAGGTSTFEKIDAPITIKDGVITSNDLIVKSQKSQIDLDGFVNLPSQNLKLDGEITFVEQRNLPGLGLTISGPLYAPKKQLKTDNIIRFYTQKATKELGQKALDKLFGTQQLANDTSVPLETNTNAPTATPTENEANTVSPTTTETPVSAPVEEAPKDVEDVLKEQGEQLLRGLLGG